MPVARPNRMWFFIYIYVTRSTNTVDSLVYEMTGFHFLRIPTLNHFKPEFTIVIFIHYKPRIAVAILDL